jgi:prolyl-tRNA synthetase
MRLSRGFWKTFKEIPADAEIPSHQLLMRAGLISKTAAGIYSYLPMALRVKQKIEQVVREEHNKIDSCEVLMSMVTPGELWKESGRWETMGTEMLRLKDAGGRDMCLSPTNEETVTDIFRSAINSYKQLPVSLYQINTKFRDELRPRFGLMRGREFTMKDAYSFHIDKESLDKGYDEFYQCYSNIFTRLGLDFMVVEADAGAMASSDQKTHEFQVLAENGEDEVVVCKETNYAANVEKAKTTRGKLEFLSAQDLKEVETPNKKTIEDVCKFLNKPQHQSLKALIYTAITEDKEEHILVMTLGDDSLNELKLKALLSCDHLNPAKEETFKELGLNIGFIGPVGNKLRLIYDEAIMLDSSYIVGANKVDYHFEGFVPSRDSKDYEQADLRLAKTGDFDETGKYQIEIKRGIEVGHIFQLGDKYSKSMNATVLDKNGKAVAPLMGCYGIGITRTLQAAIEQNHDVNGIVWPKEIAPYQVYFGLIARKDETKQVAEELYSELLEAGFEVLFDDRGIGPGPMFKDADLIGLPLRIVLGERDYSKTGEVEIAIRKTGEKIKVKLEESVAKLQELWKSL